MFVCPDKSAFVPRAFLPIAWQYIFGLDKDGNTPERELDNGEVLSDGNGFLSGEKATKRVWRRIANNLPYLLKHKGSIRGIQALLTCYGIPSSNLSIIEFGGPQVDDAGETSKYIFDSLTANLVFTSGSTLSAKWDSSVEAIEIKLKPTSYSNINLVSGSEFQLQIVTGSHSSNTFGSVQLTTNGTNIISGSGYQFFDGNYHSLLLNKTFEATYVNSTHFTVQLKVTTAGGVNLSYDTAINQLDN